MLDLRRKFSHDIIGDRSYSNSPKIVSNIGNYCIRYFHQNGIGCIMKHIPGHGASTSDSHKKTPKISLTQKKLNEIDF